YPLKSSAQKNFQIYISLKDTLHQGDFDKIKNQLTGRKLFSDSVACNGEMQSVLLKLVNSGYLTAAFDSIRYDSLACHAELFLGDRYEWITLSKGNVD